LIATWTTKIELYCSQPSLIYWAVSTSEDYLRRLNGPDIKALLKGKQSPWVNSSRDPYATILGVLPTNAEKKKIDTNYSKGPFNEDNMTYYANIELSQQLRASSRYSIVHFCENDFQVMSMFYDIENWTIQDNGSRDIEIFLLLDVQKPPTSEQKAQVTCEVSKILGSKTNDFRVISEEGISCEESKTIFGKGDYLD
jgi:hypothetical protein